MTKLSPTSVEKYLSCSEKYRLHYIENLRPNEISSPLFFGSALDLAFSRLLLEKKQNLTESEKKTLLETPERIFTDAFTNVKLNNEIIDARVDLRTKFSKKDFDSSICPDANLEIIEKVQANLTNKKISTVEDFAYYHHWCWESLRIKGLLMIDAYKTEVIPKIAEVFSIQRRISIINEEGDEFFGFVDLECEFLDELGIRYTGDDKTSSVAYPKNAVEISEQLASYEEVTGNPKAVLIVLEKILRKKEPRVKVTIIRGVISEKTKDLTFARIDSALYGIKNEIFEKNFNSCFSYGQKCAYFEKCKFGKKDHLIKLDKWKEK